MIKGQSYAGEYSCRSRYGTSITLKLAETVHILHNKVLFTDTKYVLSNKLSLILIAIAS